MIKYLPFVVVVTFALFVLGIATMIHREELRDQQRRIDQLSQATIALARMQGAEDGNGFMDSDEYCFFFADYSRGIAIVGKFDGKISYDKKPKLVILRNVEEEILRSWDKAELCYG